jgi:hypothetical protein
MNNNPAFNINKIKPVFTEEFSGFKNTYHSEQVP